MRLGCLSWALPLMWIIGSIYHIWTIIIAFKTSFLAGVLTIFLPGLANIYWFFKMWGENWIYTCLALFVLAGAIILSIFKE